MSLMATAPSLILQWQTIARNLHTLRHMLELVHSMTKAQHLWMVSTMMPFQTSARQIHSIHLLPEWIGKWAHGSLILG